MPDTENAPSQEPAQRRIYQFSLPQYGEFFVDPLAARRELMQASGNKIWKWINRCRDIRREYIASQNANPEGVTEEQAAYLDAILAELMDLEGRIAGATFAAFRLPSLDQKDGTGLVEAEALKLVSDFAGWLEKKG